MNKDINELVAKALLKKDPSDEGIVYLLDMEVDDVRVVKIGVTRRKIWERVVEITTSYFHKYRYFPRVKPMKFSKANGYFAVETMLHRYFREMKYWAKEQFMGSNELFKVDEEVVKTAYMDAMDGVDILQEDYPDCVQLDAIVQLERIAEEAEDELPDGFLTECEIRLKKERIRKLVEAVGNDEWITHIDLEF